MLENEVDYERVHLGNHAYAYECKRCLTLASVSEEGVKHHLLIIHGIIDPTWK